MYGIIDLGSNTVRLSIYQIKNGDLSPYTSRKETIGLASYVDRSNHLTKEGIEQAKKVIILFKNYAKQARVKRLYVIATASLRNVANGKEVRELLEKETGLAITQLSGEEEALCDFYGVKLTRDFEDGFVVDIGGGSTEIVEYDQGIIKHAFAIPIGSLNSYVKYVNKILPTEKELEAISDEVLLHLKEKNITFNLHETIYGVGGTNRAVKKLNQHFVMKDGIFSPINRKSLKKIMKILMSSDKDAHIDLIRIIPERVHTILPGMVILKTIAKYLNVDYIVVENYGVREGFLYQEVLLDHATDTQSKGESFE